MKNRWSAQEIPSSTSPEDPMDPTNAARAARLYSSRLLGGESALVLHGGGNVSVKGLTTDLLGRPVPTLFVKASGHDMAHLTTEGLPGLRLEGLKALQVLETMDDATMTNQLRLHRLDAQAATPSIEALLHAFLPPRFIDHTHADAILALSNQTDGFHKLQEALGTDILILPYVHPGFALAKAAAQAFADHPKALGMVLMKHGLVTWGEEAETAYNRHIELVSRAESYLEAHTQPRQATVTFDQQKAARGYRALAPALRGLLAIASGDPDRPYHRRILRPLLQPTSLTKAAFLTPPLTADHLIRTKPLPAWIEDATQIKASLDRFRQQYGAYFKRHATARQTPCEDGPRILHLPAIGTICVGESAQQAEIVRDISRQTLQVKERIAAMGGTYEGLSEEALFAMEYDRRQQEKLIRGYPHPLSGVVGLVTGAAGAIGAGLCRELLQQGCHVAAADLAGPPLTQLVEELAQDHPGQIIPVAMDVTRPEAVTEGFGQVIDQWGGVDLVVANAGLAHVAPLQTLELAAFQRLQRVNVEGTLHVLAEAGRLMEKQATGGDIVLISTKNVFAPGAQFGAYSATKAAAHQLARIASLEMAPLDIRVNMVAPDAVFSDGTRQSGLWAEVGPDRMKARGLDEAGLASYYRNRNLLKAAITARHVARAVLYFATRQSPTTGATLPVDGGLPDATPR